MTSKNFLKLFIVTLPAPMVFHEAMELKKHLQNSSLQNGHLVMNGSFTRIPNVKREFFPAFFQSKLESEEDILHKHKKEFLAIFHHVDQVEEASVVDRLAPLTGGML